MGFRLSKRSLSRLDGVMPILISIFKEGVKDSPYDFGIPSTGGLRTDQDQLDLYAIGRTIKKHKKPVTWTLNSNHKAKPDGYGHAVDIYAYVNGKASWNMKYLKPIAKHLKEFAMKEYGVELEWGYDLWKKDGAHFQVPYKN